MTKIIQCPKCKYEQQSSNSTCPQCGFTFEIEKVRRPKSNQFQNFNPSQLELANPQEESSYSRPKPFSSSKMVSKLKQFSPPKVVSKLKRFSKPTLVEILLIVLGILLVILSFWF